MSRSPRVGGRRLIAAAASTALVVTGLAVGAPAQADPQPAAAATVSDTRELSPDLAKQTSASLSKAERDKFGKAAASLGNRAARNKVASNAETGTGGVAIGGTKNWLLLDDTKPTPYGAGSYVLRGVGDNIEIWVQADINFPTGDCRNDGVRNVVTDAQVNAMITEFDTNILPKESTVFSTAPERDGTKSEDIGFGAPLWQLLGGGDPNYYKGDGNKTVVLVSNVRDDNYYAPTTPDGATFIAGFFSSLFNEAFDRNVMTIDSYDWFHRTGANPPSDGPGGLCDPGQPGRARDYEGTFAHEYQHLLEYYASPGETTWLNEGLADYAQSLVGYVDTRIPYGQPNADSHIGCFQGFAGTSAFPYCGAENSLTQWEDQGSPSTLSDYGAAYSFVTYVADHFGAQAITFLHNDDRDGLESLQAYLDDNAAGLTSMDVLHDWIAQNALDRLVDNKAKGLTKDQKARFTSADLSSAIDWAWTGSYDSPGAPPNGSDYVLATSGRPVNVSTISSLNFRGAKSYTPDPLEWVVNDGALYSGVGHDVDRAAIYSVSVPAGTPSLTFDTKYDIEQDWDFGFVQVSTDGGKTFTSLANANTQTEHADGAAGNIVDELPGLSGLKADAYHAETFDLSAYAGKEVLLSFRYMTDAAANGNTDDPSASGWWVKNVKVGSTVVTDGTTTVGARSQTEVAPIAIDDWNVQLVGWSLDGKKVSYADLPLNANHAITLNRAALKKLVKGADRVGVIVTVDDPNESARKYGTYTLRVNGTLQPGGGSTAVAPVNAKVKLPLSKRLPANQR